MYISGTAFDFQQRLHQFPQLSGFVSGDLVSFSSEYNSYTGSYTGIYNVGVLNSWRFEGQKYQNYYHLTGMFN